MRRVLRAQPMAQRLLRRLTHGPTDIEAVAADCTKRYIDVQFSDGHYRNPYLARRALATLVDWYAGQGVISLGSTERAAVTLWNRVQDPWHSWQDESQQTFSMYCNLPIRFGTGERSRHLRGEIRLLEAIYVDY